MIDAPVLFESGFDKECDVTIAVVGEYETLIKRITERDGISRQAAEKRLVNQYSKEYFKEKCTYVIENSSDINALEASFLTLKIPEILSVLEFALLYIEFKSLFTS